MTPKQVSRLRGKISTIGYNEKRMKYFLRKAKRWFYSNDIDSDRKMNRYILKADWYRKKD